MVYCDKEEAHFDNLSLKEMVQQAKCVFGTEHEYEIESVQTALYDAEYDEDLDGFVVTFSDGKQGYTQFRVEDNRLHGGYGEKYLEPYPEYDDDLSQVQEAAISELCEAVDAASA